jgi:hypothetical protein
MKNFIKHSYLRPLSLEMSSSNFGDERLSDRLGDIMDSMAHNPAQSFPKALGTEAAREGFYRFLRNDVVSVESILEPHIESTCKRVVEQEDVLVLHDTTDFLFPCESERVGLGWIHPQNKKKRGFFGHFALAVSEDDSHLPLGVLGFHSYFRQGNTKGYRNEAQRREAGDSEALRWGKLVHEIEVRLSGKANLTHVMDREADSFGIFFKMHSNNEEFITRICYDRMLSNSEINSESRKLFDVFDGLPVLFEREVPICRRKKDLFAGTNRAHPSRKSRMAKLAFTASRVEIKRPKHGDKKLPETMQLNIVRIYEPDCPEGVEPIEWKLFTTKPIDTVEQVVRTVDNYRARWIIEEYFKALKTGCAYEKRQLESKQTLLNALAVLIPIAWRLLSLRALGRSHPDLSAGIALSETQLQVLCAVYEKKFKKKLPVTMNVAHAMLAVAALGGHIKNNGLPGWQVLGRGYQDLLQYELGWIAATEGKM